MSSLSGLANCSDLRCSVLKSNQKVGPVGFVGLQRFTSAYPFLLSKLPARTASPELSHPPEPNLLAFLIPFPRHQLIAGADYD